MNSRKRLAAGIIVILVIALFGFSAIAQGQAIKMEYNKEIGKIQVRPRIMVAANRGAL